MGERDSGDVNQLESVARVLMSVKKMCGCGPVAGQ